MAPQADPDITSPSHATKIECARLWIEIVTFIALVAYTLLTYGMLRATRDNVALTKQLALESAFPIVSVALAEPPANVADPEPLDPYFIIQNHTKTDAQLYVKLDIRVNGQPVDLEKMGETKYSGRDVWTAPAFNVFVGHFDIERVLKLFGSSLERMKESQTGDPAGPSISLIINYSWTDRRETDRREGMARAWHFDVKRERWVLDP